MSELWAQLTHLFVASCGTLSKAEQTFSTLGKCDNSALLWLRRLTPSVMGWEGPCKDMCWGLDQWQQWRW